MLDPLTAISLASAVVQFTDFGLKLVRGSVELYYSTDGTDEERSSIESHSSHVGNLADKVLFPLENSIDNGPASVDEEELRGLAEACKKIASDLVSLLDGLKVKKPTGPGRKWESFRKAVAAQTPGNKDKIAFLEKKLRLVQEDMFHLIKAMMR